VIKEKLTEISRNFELLAQNGTESIQLASTLMLETLIKGRTIFFCGNGGSAADSQHLAAELVGKYKQIRKPLKAIALTTDTSALTAIANDFSFDDIFSRQLEGLGQEEDLLYAISTSGMSKNIIKVIKLAKENKIKIVGLTGENDSDMSKFCDVLIKVPAKSPDRIQEMHIAVGQIICEIIENKLCSDPQLF
tara:strand:- start:2 stop:577 length:576 start_codon:yes stop_codon:yes gene_type:complete